MFGEQSAMNDLPNPFTVVACSNKVEIYKIHRTNFSKHFGGPEGEAVNAVRGEMIIQNNWFHQVLGSIELMNVSSRMELEFCSDLDLADKKPKI